MNLKKKPLMPPLWQLQEQLVTAIFVPQESQLPSPFESEWSVLVIVSVSVSPQPERVQVKVLTPVSVQVAARVTVPAFHA